MSHTYTDILLHVVFSTKDRRPTISPNVRPRLFPFMAGILKEAETFPLLINGPSDHVHILLAIPARLSLADVIRELKSVSSLWIHKTFPEEHLFGWQTGYAAFSVSHSNRDIVQKYIATQEEHHRTVSFKEEFLQLLRRHEIEFDERYVWD
jgi:REP element-mobilizing transposase RayT